MSKYECPVVRVTIEPHPNADAIEIAKVGGYTCIVQKGRFKTGDPAVYVPEQSVLPEWLLKLMGFWDAMNNKGLLSGSAGNRVKAIRLRGVFSQGLLIPFVFQDGDYLLPMAGEHPELGVGFDYVDVTETVVEGRDFSDYFGITKYEPQLPTNMSGRAVAGDLDVTIAYDFENIKKCPGMFADGVEVSITEKLHGTLLQVGLIPFNLWEGKPWADRCPDIGSRGFKGIVTSKGQGAKGILIDPSDTSNLYVATVIAEDLWNKLDYMRLEAGESDLDPIFLLGEVFGAGVQDLTYGQAAKAFRAFDIFVGTRATGMFAGAVEFTWLCKTVGVPTVPDLYVGPFSMSKLLELTDGNTVVGDQRQIREGVVVKAVKQPPGESRLIAKSVSEKYLLRKNATEFA